MNTRELDSNTYALPNTYPLHLGDPVEWHDGSQWQTGHHVSTPQNCVVHHNGYALVSSYGELYLVDPAALKRVEVRND